MPLSGILGDVTQERLRGVLLERRPALLDAASPEQVDAFHAAGLANGGTCEGQPGPRGHLPGAYAAYLRDPAGNKVCSYTFV